MPPQNFSSEMPKVMASILAGHVSMDKRFQGQGMAEESSKKLTCMLALVNCQYRTLLLSTLLMVLLMTAMRRLMKMNTAETS